MTRDAGNAGNTLEARDTADPPSVTTSFDPEADRIPGALIVGVLMLVLVLVGIVATMAVAMVTTPMTAGFCEVMTRAGEDRGVGGRRKYQTIETHGKEKKRP